MMSSDFSEQLPLSYKLARESQKQLRAEREAAVYEGLSASADVICCSLIVRVKITLPVSSDVLRVLPTVILRFIVTLPVPESLIETVTGIGSAVSLRMIGRITDPESVGKKFHRIVSETNVAAVIFASHVYASSVLAFPKKQ